MKQKTILVTGGAGLIGLEVCRQLIARGHRVQLLDLPAQIERVRDAIPADVAVHRGSVLVPADVDAAMTGCDAAIHLAALVGVRRTETRKRLCLELNITGTRNVLECAVQRKLGKVVFASSSEVYGEPIENPLTEESLTQGKTVYGVSKLTGEELCKAYAQEYPLACAILRYFNSYGPYQVAQFVVPRFVKNVMEGRPPVIHGDGRQVRTYTYVADTAEATVLAALKREADGQTLNIGHEAAPVTLLELAQLVIRIGGKEGILQPEIRGDFKRCDRDEKREIFERYCLSAKARAVLGWQPKTTLEEGIRQVFASGKLFDHWADFDDE